MAIPNGDYTNIRKGYHRNTFYLSALKPKTLWVATATAAAARGTVAVTFDTGSGLDFSAIEADQVVWVGSGIGEKDYGVLRIRSISSGDAGVTGTVNVAWHGYAFGPGAFLTFVHDYPVFAKLPWLGQDGLMGSQGVFYKDIFDTYVNQTQSNKIRPVADILLSHNAGFLVDGEQTFWVDASPSYAMAPGATISSYGLAVYPTTGATVTFNTSTGVGYVVVTDPTEEYYWFKFTITDSNGSVRIYRTVVFSHSLDVADGTYPIKDFTIGQYSDDWESGGINSRVIMTRQLTDVFIGDRHAVDMIDTARCVLWSESVMGKKYFGGRRMPRVRADNHLFVSPDISVSVTASATCDIDSTLHAGVMIDNKVPADATNISLDVQVNAETPIPVTGVVTNGIVEATETGIAALLGACNSGTLKWLYNGTVIATATLSTGKLYTGSSIYPSSFLAHPFDWLVGYIRNNDIDQDTSKGTGKHTYALATPDAILRNNFMFSIPIDAQNSPTKWHHYHKDMTTASAAMFVLDFHSNAFETMMITGLDSDTDLRAYGEFSGQNLYAMVDGIIRNEGIRAHFKCDRQGKMHLIYDTQILTDTERAAVSVESEVFPQDRAGELSIKENPEPGTAMVYGSGIYWDGTFDGEGKVRDGQVDAFCSLAPWYIPMWGGGATATLERQTVRSQLHMNQLTGRVYAKMNNVFPSMSWSWDSNYLPLLAIDSEEFWFINIQTVDNPKSLVFINKRVILRNIECTIDVTTGSVVVNTTWEPEADGLDGVTAVCPELDIDLGGLPPISWAEFGGLLPGTIVTSN